MPQVRPNSAPAAVIHRSHALQRALNRSRLKSLFVRALAIGVGLMNALPNRISHNVNLVGMDQCSAALSDARWSTDLGLLRIKRVPGPRSAEDRDSGVDRVRAG